MDRDALAVHQRHLVRKVSSALSRETGLPGNLLTEAAVSTKFVGGTGFPELADSVAYEPTQGLLAVGGVVQLPPRVLPPVLPPVLAAAPLASSSGARLEGRRCADTLPCCPSWPRHMPCLHTHRPAARARPSFSAGRHQRRAGGPDWAPRGGGHAPLRLPFPHQAPLLPAQQGSPAEGHPGRRHSAI